MKVKEESEIADIRLNILKRKIMAFSPFPSWQIDRETGNSGTLSWLSRSLRLLNVVLLCIPVTF